MPVSTLLSFESSTTSRASRTVNMGSRPTAYEVLEIRQKRRAREGSTRSSFSDFPTHILNASPFIPTTPSMRLDCDYSEWLSEAEACISTVYVILTNLRLKFAVQPWQRRGESLSKSDRSTPLHSPWPRNHRLGVAAGGDNAFEFFDDP